MRSPPTDRPAVQVVVQQHLESAEMLRSTRSVQVRAPHIELHRLRRLDERLAAHLDGLLIAGDVGRQLAVAALETPSPAVVFVVTVGAIEARDPAQLERLLALAGAVPHVRTGLVSAFGWVPPASLRGITRALLDSANAFRRDLGLAACGLQGVDPGPSLEHAMADVQSAKQAMMVAGRLGRMDLLPECLHGLLHEDEALRFEAARAAVLLGDRHAALRTLWAFAQTAGSCQAAAATLALQLLPDTPAQALLHALARDPVSPRLLVRGIGVLGHTDLMPWVLERMQEPALARLAGESFSLITGLDLAALDLDANVPPDFASGPNEDPEDDDTGMDEDDGLPWPDVEKIRAWWQANASRFAPGTRYFMGQPPSPAHCLAVLKSGCQRQRSAAAIYRSLLEPGTPLFNTAAPAWRQQYRLDATSK